MAMQNIQGGIGASAIHHKVLNFHPGARLGMDTADRFLQEPGAIVVGCNDRDFHAVGDATLPTDDTLAAPCSVVIVGQEPPICPS